MTIDSQAIINRLPHGPNMHLIDTIISINTDTLLCQTNSHQNPNNPLMEPDGHLSIWHGIEYAAQAAACHQIFNMKSDKLRSGLVAQVSQAQAHCSALSSILQPLNIEVTCIINNGPIAKYHCTIQADRVLLTATLTLVQDMQT